MGQRARDGARRAVDAHLALGRARGALVRCRGRARRRSLAAASPLGRRLHARTASRARRADAELVADRASRALVHANLTVGRHLELIATSLRRRAKRLRLREMAAAADVLAARARQRAVAVRTNEGVVRASVARFRLDAGTARRAAARRRRARRGRCGRRRARRGRGRRARRGARARRRFDLAAARPEERTQEQRKERKLVHASSLASSGGARERRVTSKRPMKAT